MIVPPRASITAAWRSAAGRAAAGPAYAMRPSTITTLRVARPARAPVPSTSCPLRMIVVPWPIFIEIIPMAQRDCVARKEVDSARGRRAPRELHRARPVVILQAERLQAPPI